MISCLVNCLFVCLFVCLCVCLFVFVQMSKFCFCMIDKHIRCFQYVRRGFPKVSMHYMYYIDMHELQEMDAHLKVVFRFQIHVVVLRLIKIICKDEVNVNIHTCTCTRT